MNIFLSILLLILCNVSYGEESIKPRFNLVRSFDACDIDKRITFYVSIDNVDKADSLYGFNLGLKYDTTKVLYSNYLTANTIMSKFEQKFATNNKESQTINIDGGVFGSIPLSGDSNLVAFEFNYIADDFSSATFSIDYLVMTEEYTREIEIKESIIEYSPETKDKEERKIELISSLNNITIDSTLMSKIYLDSKFYNDNRLNNFDFKLTYDKKLISLSLIQNEDYTLEKIDENLLFDVYRISSDKLISTEKFLEIDIIQNIEIKSENTSSVEVEIIDWDRKSCITRKGESITFDYITYENKVENSIRSLIESSKSKRFEIYNLMGEKVFESKFNTNSIPKLEKGLYIIKSESKVEKIIIN